jgi:hypothetical protein
MPVYEGSGSRTQSASDTSRSPAKPSVGGVSGVLYALVTSHNNDTHSCSDSNWQKVAQANAGGSFTASLWRAPETASAPTFTWPNAAACAARIAYFADPSNALEAAPGSTTSNSGTANPHTTSSITSTRDNSLFVYFDAAAANTAIAQPTGWTEETDAGSGTDGGRTAIGTKDAGSSGSSSGAISVNGANAAWVQFQVEIRGTAPVGFQVSKESVTAWLEPVPGFAVSGMSVLAWLEPGSYPPPSSGRRRALIVN